MTGKPGFSIGSNYRAPDYTNPYEEKLPGADFNRQVYQFDEREKIWDQNDYEERTKQEAEMLVALEALKTSANYLDFDIYKLKQEISTNRSKIGANQEDVWKDSEVNYSMLQSANDKINHAYSLCSSN